MMTKLHHVNLCSNNVPEMDRFYREVLNLAPIPGRNEQRVTNEGYSGEVAFAVSEYSPPGISLGPWQDSPDSADRCPTRLNPARPRSRRRRVHKRRRARREAECDDGAEGELISASCGAVLTTGLSLLHKPQTVARALRLFFPARRPGTPPRGSPELTAGILREGDCNELSCQRIENRDG